MDSVSSVKQVKYLLKKYQCQWETFEDNLLEWKDTPNDSGKTPSEMFLARRVRTSLPILPGKTEFDIEGAVAGAERRKEVRKKQSFTVEKFFLFAIRKRSTNKVLFHN